MGFAQNGNLKSAKDTTLNSQVALWMQNNSGLKFLENKGQMTDMQGKVDNDLLFKANARGVDMYVTTNGISYVFTKFEKHMKAATLRLHGGTHKFHQPDDSVTEQYCRADMDLVGADIRKENIIKTDGSTERTDFYQGSKTTSGILNVHSYGKITIKNIYPGIDWVLYKGQKGLKYDFIVHPGADPSLIKLEYKWTDTPEISPDGSMNINTPMGKIAEGNPISYCGESRNNIETGYIQKSNEISFKLGNYNHHETLTIDPTLVWATYYGQASDFEDVYSMYDDSTYVYVTGFTDNSSFPTLNPGGGTYFHGAIPNTNGNIFILQFNTAGVLIWSTCYGVSGWANSIYSDRTHLWVTGQTDDVNFPLYNPGGGAYFQPTLMATNGATQNAFILKFTTKGVREWATYYGGNGNDIGHSIHCDGKSVWVCGTTSSTTFPTMNPGGGAYFQGTFAGIGGLYTPNGFILQFDTGGVSKWATYYGGDGCPSGPGDGTGDIPNWIYSDGKNVWVTGGTSSNNFPVFNPGAGAFYQGTLNGFYSAYHFNAFFLKFNTSGVRRWATYCGGNGGNGDEGYSICSNGTKVWACGQTESNNFPTQNPGGGAYYQGTRTGVYDSYIMEFDTAAVLDWSTFYAGSGGNYDIAYTIQNDGTSIWVCGATGSIDFPTLNPGCGSFYQGASHGYDPYILQFTHTGVLEWATPYGIDIEDDESIVCSDGRNVFISGDADDNKYPAVNPGGGAYYMDTMNRGENIFIGKFCLPCGTFPIVSLSAPPVICQDDSTTLTASGGTAYSWSTGATTSTITVKPLANTTYSIIVGSGTCVFDTSITVTVNPLPNAIFSGPATICIGDTATISISGGTSYTWSSGPTTSTIKVNPISTTSYTVSVSNGSCVKDTSITVIVNSLPIPVISGTPSKCTGEKDTLTASGGTSYIWGNGNTSNTYYTGPINGDSTLTVTVFNVQGCSHDTTFAIHALTTPTAVISPLTGSVCTGDSVMLSANGGTTYRWSNSKTSTTIWVSPLAKTTYTLFAFSGPCSDSVTTDVTIIPKLTATISQNDTICPKITTILTATGNGGNVTYKWNTGQTTSSITVSDSVNTTYTITVYGTCDSLKKNVSVIVEPLAKPVISGNMNICLGGRDTLHASGVTNYHWGNGSTAATLITGIINTDTVVTLVAYNSLGCPDTTNYAIRVLTQTVSVNSPTICSGNCVSLKATPIGIGVTYQWSNGATTDSTIVCDTTSTTYSVTINSQGCNYERIATVNVFDPSLYACCDTVISYGESATLMASSSSKYSWTPSIDLSCDTCSTVSVSPSVTTTYTVTGTDSHGCSSQQQITVIVEFSCFNLTVPNVFTPNYIGPNGVNNIFYIKTENITNWSITIYDRWGKEVFKTTNQNQYWTGTTESGWQAPDGVYYYIINAICQGTNYKKDGYVQLIR